MEQFLYFGYRIKLNEKSGKCNAHEECKKCDLWGFNIGVVEDYVTLLFATLWRNVLPSPPRTSNSWRWRWDVPSKRRAILTQLCSITPYKTGTHDDKCIPSLCQQIWREKRNERASGKIILTRLLMKTIVRLWSGLDWLNNPFSWRMFNIFDHVICHYIIGYFCGDRLRLFSISVTADTIELGPQD